MHRFSNFFTTGSAEQHTTTTPTAYKVALSILGNVISEVHFDTSV